MTGGSVPEGFGPILRSSPFLDHIGPLFSRGQAPNIAIGFHVQAHHANNRGGLHGGVLPAIADVLAGYNLALSHDPPRRLITTSLAVDYLGAASVGDWLEARCEFSHDGSRLCIVQCTFRCSDREVARATVRFIPA